MRRGVSLGETLITLALMSVMFSLVALFCSDLRRDFQVDQKADRESEVLASLLRLSQELKSASQLVLPRPSQPAQEVVFRRLNPSLTWPDPVPLPPPLTWDLSGQQQEIRYFLDQGLVRQDRLSGQSLTYLSGVQSCDAQLLPDGRLQMLLNIRLEERQQSFRLLTRLPLL
ncbi:hypothetical protein JST97_35425 [bacterium]|nr:hypothetical protein [bacterium]